jgi:hypothetical protein
MKRWLLRKRGKPPIRLVFPRIHTPRAPGRGVRGRRLRRFLHLPRRFAVARKFGAMPSQAKHLQIGIGVIPFTNSQRHIPSIVSRQSTTRLGNSRPRNLPAIHSKTAQASADSGAPSVGGGDRFLGAALRYIPQLLRGREAVFKSWPLLRLFLLFGVHNHVVSSQGFHAD